MNSSYIELLPFGGGFFDEGTDFTSVTAVTLVNNGAKRELQPLNGVNEMRKDLKEITAMLKQYAKNKQLLQEFEAVSSPRLGDGITTTASNGTEAKMVRQADLAYNVRMVDNVIDSIDPSFAFIIRSYVIDKQHSATEMAQLLDLSTRGFHDRKTRALMAFKSALRRNEKQQAV